MINAIIEYSARNKFLVLLLTVSAVLLGIHAIRTTPLDAIPDLSEQQVIILSRWEQSPDIIEDQVTYPIVTSLLGAPKVRTVRGLTDYGYSFVYVIFEDGTDIYWARSRVLEYLSKILPQLPDGVKTELGPDATGVGWVYQYALTDESGAHDLADLRSYQDWNLRYLLQSVPGVAEVATIGGSVQQYQVQIEPNALLAYNVPITKVVEMIRKGNNDIGARLLEFGGTEYMVRGRGYIRDIEDLKAIVVAVNDNGTPIRVQDLGQVTLGPDIRRGIADLDGRGDSVGGIVVVRYGENAKAVIDRVKQRLDEIRPTLPAGMEIVTTYDRSELIERSVGTLRHELTEELLIVSIVILLFLWHFSSALLPILTIPISVIIAFIPFKMMGLTANIMSLGGIAVAIGALVDSSIVVVENAHKKLEQWIAGGRQGDYHPVLIQAVKEVGRASFFSLLVIAVSFMPIFALEAQEGRLFKPLAFTKNLAMAIAAILTITLVPALITILIRMRPLRLKSPRLSRWANRVLVGTIHREEDHPISHRLHRWYAPVVHWVLEHPRKVIWGAAAALIVTLPIYFQIGSEFMPPLNEGTILYMPTTLPGISVSEAERLLQNQDTMLKSFPEVERVFGKAGRAETATDPAPLSMAETVVLLKPGVKLTEELINRFDAAMQFPGTTNAWTMPIKTRLDMLSTGIRTPIGIKVLGEDLAVIEQIGLQIEQLLQPLKGTRSIFAERVTGGYFLDIDLQRSALARYGMSIEDAQEVLETAIGGKNITVTVEGRARYPVNVRYARELRDDIQDLERVLVPTPGGEQIPLAAIATVQFTTGPGMIRDENGLLAGYVFIDVAGRDLGGYVDEAKALLASRLKLPDRYFLDWSGQYEFMVRVRKKLAVVVPITLVIIFLLIYINTGSATKTAIVLLAVPFSAIGTIWLLWLLDYNMSIAVWVGIIALLGIDAETGIFMLLYLDLAYDDAKATGRMRTMHDLREAILHGAVKRVRPKVMTVATTFMGLMPIMWSFGTGADVMKRIAAPMVGGLATSFLMELIVYPAIYFLWKQRHLAHQGAT
ncbi:MAG: efflux RND transporter permease subunit [Deltaproteobacteria bacterium]|nr:efflux RND transporter permease subunit [Deltaproteobacteria bacterium]